MFGVWGRGEAVYLEVGRNGVRGVRGEQGEGGMERRVGLKGVGLIRSGLRVLSSGILSKLCWSLLLGARRDEKSVRK